jgi:type IV pilus assembly protein PilM
MLGISLALHPADMNLGSLLRPSTVGVDIGSSAVKAVCLKRSRSGWSLVAAGEAPLPDGSMQDGAVADAALVSDTLNQLLDSMKMRRATVASALSGHAVIVKRLSLPAMSQAELAEAIPWEAEQYIPFDIADVQLDYQVVGSMGAGKSDKDKGDKDASAGDKSGLDVLLVAARKDRIDDRAGVIAQAGRRPVIVDVEAVADADADPKK